LDIACSLSSPREINTPELLGESACISLSPTFSNILMAGPRFAARNQYPNVNASPEEILFLKIKYPSTSATVLRQPKRCSIMNERDFIPKLPRLEYQLHGEFGGLLTTLGRGMSLEAYSCLTTS